MKRKIAFAAATLTFALSGTAFATPSFGPGGSNGNGNNDPQETGAACHPPGQTSDLHQCK